MKADGPRLDGTATAAGTEEGRVGRVLHLPVCRRRVVGGLKKKAGATPVPGEAASWERTTTASSLG